MSDFQEDISLSTPPPPFLPPSQPLLDGKNLLLQAQSGHGKTAIFATAILNAIDTGKERREGGREGGREKRGKMAQLLSDVSSFSFPPPSRPTALPPSLPPCLCFFPLRRARQGGHPGDSAGAQPGLGSSGDGRNRGTGAIPGPACKEGGREGGRREGGREGGEGRNK